MSKEKYNNKQLYLGIDGGGSKCRAILYSNEDGIVADAVSGPANVLRGIEKAQQHIIEATDTALAQVGLTPDFKANLIAGIGLAGLNLEACMTEMKRWNSPFKQSFYTTDLHIACVGAHGGKDGAVMIIGTGSSALVCQNNKLIEMGGHGFPVGDAGSGAWVGYKSIELALLVLDGLKPETDFIKAICKHYQITTAIELAQAVSGFTPTEFGRLAPLVVQHAQLNDQHAVNILKSGAEYLSALATKLLQDKTLKLSLIGGLSPLMQPYLSPEVVGQLKEAEQPPEVGAVLYAQQQSSACAVAI